MKADLTPKDVTPELKDAITAYVARRTEAEVIRERVDAVQRRVLTELRLYNDLLVKYGLDKERILDPDGIYLSEDEDALGKYYKAVDEMLREAGIKPDDMELDYCPALVAERAQIEAEWDLIDEAAKMLGVYEGPREFNSALLCAGGLEKRQQFIDLTVGLVISLG